MYKNANGDVDSHGIMMYKNETRITDMDFSNETAFFHIQDYKAGFSYGTEYYTFASQNILTMDNQKMLRKIARKIATLHMKST
jgi:hypothetical protein